MVEIWKSPMVEIWKSKMTGIVCPVLHWEGDASTSDVQNFFIAAGIKEEDLPTIRVCKNNLFFIKGNLELNFGSNAVFMVQANTIMHFPEALLESEYCPVVGDPTVITIDTKGLTVEEAVQKVRQAYEE